MRSTAQNKGLAPLVEGAKRAITVAHCDDILSWLDQTLYLRDSPYGNRFKSVVSPWLHEPLRSLTDPNVREIWIMASAQGGKTIALLSHLLYSLVHDPGPTMVVLDTDKAAVAWWESKLDPTLKHCPALVGRLPQNPERYKKSAILMPDATVRIGPANNSFLRSHSIRYLACDEVSKWPVGNIANAKARCRQFGDRKMVFCSTPLDVDNEFTVGWESGSREYWAFGCLGCGEPFAPKFREHMRWDSGPEVKPNGVWDIVGAAATARLVCPRCGHEHPHTAETIARLNAGGRYVSDRSIGAVRSFHFSSLVLSPKVCSWSELVAEFLSAKISAEIRPPALLKEFVNLQLAEPWDDVVPTEEKISVSDTPVQSPADFDGRCSEGPFLGARSGLVQIGKLHAHTLCTGGVLGRGGVGRDERGR